MLSAFRKDEVSIIFAVFVGSAGCFGQIAKDSKPDIFQFSAAGGFPSRETQVKGALHHYTVSAGTQYNDRNLYGYYGLGGYYPSLGLVAGGGVDEFNMWTYVSHKASVAHLWRTFRRVSFGVGADAFYDKGGNENRNAFGISGAVDYFLTRNLLISGRVGAYLNGKADNTSPIYETIGLNYSLDGSKWYIPYVGFSTKANAGKAEHLEIVIGFRFG